MIAASQRQRYERHARIEIDFQVGRAECIPFAAERLDVGCATMTILCVVEDARPVFQEIAPAGRLVMDELGK